MKTPCNTCPFRRDVQPGALGGSPVTTFVGQVHGPFWLPCHSFTNYSDPNWKTDYSKPQCVGAAIYRANAVRHQLPEALLKMEPDHKLVFSTPEQFLSHHLRIPPSFAASALHAAGGVEHFIQQELQREGARHVTL